MDPTTTSVLGAVVTAVGIAFRYMWTKMIKRHEECEKDRVSLWGVVNANQEDLAVFKGCQTRPCGAFESIKQKKKFDDILKNNTP